MVDRLYSCGIYFKHQVLDKKSSEAYKVAIRSNNMISKEYSGMENSVRK